MAQFNIK